MRFGLLFTFALLLVVKMYGQDKNQLILGEVFVVQDDFKNETRAGITITNWRTKDTDVTNDLGKFELPMSAGDSLQIVGKQIKNRWIVVSKRIMNRGWIRIFINENYIELDNADFYAYEFTGYLEEDLKNLPEYIDTIALIEDKINLGQILASIPEKIILPPKLSVANPTPSITLLKSGLNLGGYSKIKRNKIRLEKFQNQYAAVEHLYNYYPKEFYTKELKIPNNQIKSFLLYAVQSKQILDYIHTNQYLQLQIQMQQLAQAFNKQNNLAS